MLSPKPKPGSISKELSSQKSILSKINNVELEKIEVIDNPSVNRDFIKEKLSPQLNAS